MTKAELYDYARAGVRQRLVAIERLLADLYREFPAEFAGDSAPVFVKPETKLNGNSWPPFEATHPENGTNGNGREATAAKISASWTPERRAKAAKAMKQRRKAGIMNNPPDKPWGSFAWQRLHDALAQREDRTASVADLCKAANIRISPTLYSAVKLHHQLFKKTANGDIYLKKVLEQPQG